MTFPRSIDMFATFVRKLTLLTILYETNFLQSVSIVSVKLITKTLRWLRKTEKSVRVLQVQGCSYSRTGR